MSPAQLFGIEVNPRAKSIAELVLWLGHLQWYYKTHGRLQPPPEPVLQDLKNIECRDAVLVWDKIELVRDEKGKPVTRWDGESMKNNPVTGLQVPDERAQLTTSRYINPRKATWPAADFIVGNPPFIGSKRMRAALGDGYVEAVREAHEDVPDSADFVMYWWNSAARLVAMGAVRSAGLITTNSITSPFNKRIVSRWFSDPTPVGLAFAIPDHPWVDTAEGAAVRISMTVIAQQPSSGRLCVVDSEREGVGPDGARDVQIHERVGVLSDDLSLIVSTRSLVPLKSNASLTSMGVQLYGNGFILDAATAASMASTLNPQTDFGIVRPFANGRDLVGEFRNSFVIDFFGTSESDARAMHPAAYQHVLHHVKPERDVNRREPIRRIWWRFGWERPVWRAAASGLRRYIATCRTAKHRVFMFLPIETLPESKIVAIADDRAISLGVLSSSLHIAWALRTGSFLEDRPNYNHADCFNKFPFPACTKAHHVRISSLAEDLDAHRKRQQVAHPTLTITGMYNVLDKLRNNVEFTEKDRVIHQQGLVSVLKQIHDDLDAAVFDAYGWPRDLSDEQILEKLVALNAERAEEERTGHVRWLRPDFQNPTGARKPENLTLVGTEATDAAEEGDAATAAPAATVAAWPKRPGERIAAIRDLVVASKRLWQTAEVTAAFKGAKKKDVADLLDSLAGIGVLVAYGETEKELRWGLPTRAGVS